MIVALLAMSGFSDKQTQQDASDATASSEQVVANNEDAAANDEAAVADEQEAADTTAISQDSENKAN